MVDIMHKKCNCGLRNASFGYLNSTAFCCTICKKEGMINLKNRRCICNKQASFGYENSFVECCFDCKKEGMINLINPKCQSNGCNILVKNPRYKGYCMNCFFEKYPDEDKFTNYKIKENTIVNYIKQKLPDYDFVADKIGRASCR